MIVLFINHSNLNKNFNYIYNLFYYLKIKIKIIDNVDIYEYIDEEHTTNDIYFFFNMIDIDLFQYLNLKYNKNIYYFSTEIIDIENINELNNKINFILVSDNYKNLINFKHRKLLLSHQFDINENYNINILNSSIIFDINNKDLKDIFNNNYINFDVFNENVLYNNKIIVLYENFDEDLINRLITSNNLIIIKNKEFLEYYLFFNVLFVFDKNEDVINIIKYINSNKIKYEQNFIDYINYSKKKLLIRNKKFFQKLDKYEYVDNDFGFIILRHVNSHRTNRLWYNSLKNIRKFYRNKIYIIDDNSDYNFITNQKNIADVKVKNSIYKKRGEILPYYYLYLLKLFKRCLIIHDSVFINKYINFNKYKKDIHFLWHFDHECNNLADENTMMKLLNNDIIINKYDEKKWLGCFGVQTIINYSFVEKLHENFKIFDLIKYIDTRSKRMNFERIFSVLCNLLDENLFYNKSVYGNIKNYINWGYNFDDYINDKNSNKIDNYYLIKTWNGR